MIPNAIVKYCHSIRPDLIFFYEPISYCISVFDSEGKHNPRWIGSLILYNTISNHEAHLVVDLNDPEVLSKIKAFLLNITKR